MSSLQRVAGVTILSNEHLQGNHQFMIDSDSAINIIKMGSLKDPKINEDDKIILRDIAQTAVEFHGSVVIRLLNRSIKFYIISDDITFS